MRIDPQLLADCHVLGTLDRASLLLHRNASVGWLVLVPHTQASDWHELDEAEHHRVALQMRRLSAFSCHWFHADKMNIATIGNVVAQMHVHVIARHVGDACWPQPVWGHLHAWRDYSGAEVEGLRQALATACNLVPGGRA